MEYRQANIIAGQFSHSLCGLAIDGRGQLYAAGDSEVKAFDRAGKPVRRWATAKPPLAVGVAGDGTLYAGEAGQIEIFDRAGKHVETWCDPEYLGRVTALGFAAGGILAGDAADRAIRRLDSAGKVLNTIGKDNRVNGFLIPNGVVSFSVDPHGVIHAANPGKHRVERYTAAGELLGHIGRFDGVDPAGFPGCCNPTNVAVREHVYVSEKAGPRAKVYDFSGKLLAVIAAEVFDPNCKNMAIAVDARGRVYVADTVKLAIFVFEPVNV
jgi:sugar lactone lactonase YvrE